MAAKKNKKCAALVFAADATNDAVLAKCSAEWKKRNRKSDGTLNKNNYAPIYIVRGDEKLSARRSGAMLVLFAAVAERKLDLPKLVWK